MLLGPRFFLFESLHPGAILIQMEKLAPVEAQTANRSSREHEDNAMYVRYEWQLRNISQY